MNYKAKLFLKALFFILFIGVISCSSPEGKWEGTIEEQGGVTLVKNPREGLWDKEEKHEISIEKKLQIGQLDGPEEFLFSYISDVAVNSKGDIYVADRSWSEIRKFNQEGEHLMTIGRKGQGPGEFQSVTIVSVDPQDHLIAYDDMQGRVSVFSDSGELIQTTKNLMADSFIHPSRIIAQDDGFVLFGKFGDNLQMFHEFDKDWNYKESYIEYEFIDNKEFEKQHLNFSLGNCFFKENGEILYTKDFYDNKIFIYRDKDLAKVITKESNIKKPYEVQMFYDRNKARAVMQKQEYDFSVYSQGKNFVGRSNLTSSGVFQLSDGNIVNFVNPYISKRIWGFDVELYDSEGKLLSYSRLGENLFYDIRCKDSNGLFYAIHRYEYPKVIVFRLKY